MNRPTITAHSGCDGTADGSLAAIETGIELGADLVEVDVRRVDGLGLALTHDRVEDPTGLVTLRQAFELLKRHPRIGINCDLKEYGLAQDVIALGESVGLSKGQLAFSGSIRPQDLAADPSICQSAGVYLNIEEALSELMGATRESAPWDVVRAHAAALDGWIAQLIELVPGLGIRALNLPPKHFTGALLRRLGEAGIRVSAWTINDLTPMRELLALPFIENLTTRRVALAVEAREQVLLEVSK